MSEPTTARPTRPSRIAPERRWILALIPPLVVFVVQWAAWEQLRPYAWFLFYPAIFASGWLGGLRGGLIATLLSAALVWWFFLPPEHGPSKEPRLLFSAAAFMITGSIFAAFHDRLHKANARLVDASVKRRLIEARVQALVEQAPEGILVADLEGRYTEVNRAGCDLLGYDRDEIIRMTIVDLIPPEDVARLDEDKARLLAGEIAVGEWRLRRKDGTYLPVEVTTNILPDGRWQAFVRDITERKELEAALRATSADLERAQAVSQVGSWRLDIQRNLLRWSAEAHRIFEVPVGTSMTYEGFLDCVHPEDRQSVDLTWKAALRGAPYDIEHRLLVAGKVKWVREKAEGDFDEAGTLLGGIGITQDITERKQLEHQVRDAQERLELALRGADLATWDWNIASGEVIFNARWAEMRGFHPDEIAPRVDSWLEGLHPDDLPHVKTALDDYFAGRASEYETEHRVRTKTGGWIWILDRGKIFARDEHGQPLRMVGTELDITGRKRTEEALRLAHAVSSGILSVSADATICVDGEQRITTFNEGAEKIFGHARLEVLGAPLDILIPERFRAVHRTYLERFAAGPDGARKMGERRMSIVGLRDDGHEFPADVAISKLEVGGEKVLTATIRDITDQKRVEREQTFLADIGLVLADQPRLRRHAGEDRRAGRTRRRGSLPHRHRHRRRQDLPNSCRLPRPGEGLDRRLVHADRARSEQANVDRAGDLHRSFGSDRASLGCGALVFRAER